MASEEVEVSNHSERKQAYFTKLIKYLDEYRQILLVGADNVGSKQMQEIRVALRGRAVMLMGKNTMVRKAIRGHLDNNPALSSLLPYLKGNVGFVFTNDDLASIKEVLDSNKKPANAKAGIIAPKDVSITAGPTGQEPTKTSFFQALNIPTKIVKGQIEIINDVHLVQKNTKVGTSEAALLQMLGVTPFEYGLKVETIYDQGTVFPASLLSITDNDILQSFSDGVRNVASISLATGIPTLAAVPHALAAGFRNILAIGLGTDYEMEAVTKMLSAAASAPAATSAAAATSEKVEKAPEPEEESDEEMDLDLFG